MEDLYERSSDTSINERLSVHEKWGKDSYPSAYLIELERSLRFLFRSEGVLEALSHRFLDEGEDEEMAEILLDSRKPLRETYEITMKGIMRKDDEG